MGFMHGSPHRGTCMHTDICDIRRTSKDNCIENADIGMLTRKDNCIEDADIGRVIA